MMPRFERHCWVADVGAPNLSAKAGAPKSERQSWSAKVGAPKLERQGWSAKVGAPKFERGFEHKRLKRELSHGLQRGCGPQQVERGQLGGGLERWSPVQLLDRAPLFWGAGCSGSWAITRAALIIVGLHRA